MRPMSDDKYSLLENPTNVSTRKITLGRTKSNSLKFVTALAVFTLVFLLLFRALEVIPMRINIFWISEDNSSPLQNSLKINIRYLNGQNVSGGDILIQKNTVSAVCNDISDNDKFDCYPDSKNLDEGKCVNRGCCWKVVGEKIQGLPPLGVPYCYYPSNYEGYVIQNVSTRNNGFTLKLNRKQPSGFPKDITNVIVNITYLDENKLRIKAYDEDKPRFEVPVPIINNNFQNQIVSQNYKVDYDNKNLWITRVSTSTVIFNVSLATLVYADQMLQVSIKLPSHYVYGIGEVKDQLMRGTDWKRYVLFARDRPPEEKMNLYGSHPFYLIMENDGNSHGVLLLNSNAMEVVIQPTPALTFRPIGGILDFYISIGPSPADVVKQYTSLIGRSFMPPYWSLGFHLCRLGYNSANKTREVWQRTITHGIPLDTQWNDIDHMDKYNDFTINKSTYGDLPKFVNELHDNDMHYIMIIDPGISNAEPIGTYPPYDDGLKMDVFVKNISGDIQVGKVWNHVSTVFPDFTNPKSVDYWTKQFQNFHKLIPFDGVWIDMNEPSNFVDGSIYGCPENDSLENPPYIPGDIEPLRSKTLCMTSKQYLSSHYNVHNLHGLSELIATNAAVTDVLQKRPFIISRSTFPGSGHFGGHWDGDVYSTWDHMRWTIPSILTLNMLGISMAGADICGFNGNTTAELCARWTTLGAFYPFSRNHNSDDTIEQDPVALGEDVITAAKYALTLRYSMLPNLYTLFYRSHIYGETVVRPMFFEFPNDKATYTLDQQFLWGSHILIAPALHSGTNDTVAYLPKGRWTNCNLDCNLDIITSKGENFTFPTSLHNYNVLIREGGGILFQKPGNTTAISRKGVFTLYMLMNESGFASTELYWDDGDSLYAYEKGQYTLIEMSVQNKTFIAEPVKKGYTDNLVLKTLILQEVPTKPSVVKRNGNDVPFEFYSDRNLLHILGECSLLERCVATWQ